MCDVTIRLKTELKNQYHECDVLKAKTNITRDLTKHIESQITKYTLLNKYSKKYDNMNYSEIGFEIDEKTYTQYKKTLSENRTTVTADIIRYISTVIEK